MVTKPSAFEAAAKALPAAVAAELTPDLDAAQIRKVLSKYAMPSASELRHLHAADPTNSYRSSFFRLQVDQLLESVQHKPSAKWSSGLQSILFQVKNILESLSDQQVTKEALQMPGLCIRNHIKRKEVVLPFQKPARFDIVGSFILKNMAFARKSPQSEYGIFNIDIAVEMPSECFVPKDFMNYRYFDKRNLYLGVLASEMQSHSTLFDRVTLTGFRGETEKPIAVLHVNPQLLAEQHVKGTKHVQIRLIPVITTEVFKLAKLAPTKNNIRHDPSMSEEALRQCRTPMYNNSILEDMMVRRHTRDLHAVLVECPQFAEACILAKVWVRQRGFHKCIDSLNGFLVSMVLLYLYAKKRINAQTPSEQMHKVLIQFLATHDLVKDPLQLPPSSTDEDSVVLTHEGLQAFRSSFEVVFTDSSGRLNLFGRMTKNAWLEVQQAAKDSIKALQHATMDDFRALFIKKNEFWTRYDQYFWLPSPVVVDDADEETYSAEEKRQINDMGLEVFWMRKLQSLLTQALTDRVDHVRPVLEQPQQSEWPLNAMPAPARRRVAMGLRINPDTAWRIVDKGPAAEDKQASLAFRRFWKQKAELRRFKDGAIVEAVLWEEVPPHQKHRMLETIVKYIVHAHCPHLKSDAIKTSNASLYSALDVDDVAGSSSTTNAMTKKASTYESSLNAVSELWIVFNNFAKTLRDLDSLPLKFSDIQPVHPGFRYTSLFGVQPHPLAFSRGEKMTAAPMAHVNTVLEPLVLHLKFERSSSWPNDMDALRHAKTGFYVHIAHELETNHHLRCEVAIDCVDVFMSGYVFRLVIQSEKELTLLTARGGSTANLGTKKLAIVHSPAFIALKRETEYLTKHASTIHALHSKHTSFGPTIRLAQRWLADQFMSHALPLEAIELLVAYVYINSTTASVPHSILSGFLRFLKLVAGFDWLELPLLVDLNGAFQNDDSKQRDIQKQFQASSISPANHPAMFIAADYEDMDCLSSWTRLPVIEKVVVQRIVALAQVAYDALIQWLATGVSSAGWRKAFASSTSEFDVVLHLDVDRLPSKRMKMDGLVKKKHPFASAVFKNMDLTSVPVMVGFDPVMALVHALQKRFGHVAFFFVNGMERQEILLTWKPQAFLPSKFRAITSNCLICLPKQVDQEHDEDGTRTYAIPNIHEILSEMQQMGEGMITSVDLYPFLS